MEVGNIVFIMLVLTTAAFFTWRVRKIRRNILLGRDEDRSDRSGERWKTMARVAIGQSKMVARPVAGFFHILIYVGFVIINIEVLEIILDGVLGTHRLFSPLGAFYRFIIGCFEILAVLVILACVVFLIRRNILRLKRFHLREMTLWPRSDANIILIFEIVLMAAFLTMNASDGILMGSDEKALAAAGLSQYTGIGMELEDLWVSRFIGGFLPGGDLEQLALIERTCWWVHIVGIFIFLNYIPYSKHFHIFLAFPNTYYSDLDEKGKFDNMERVTEEVKLMMDPNADPFAAPAEGGEEEASEAEEPGRFGAKDVQDLTWKNLLDAYTCTECGRCSSVCPANQTGKMLSPRKIVMDTRDRLEEVGKNIDKHGKEHDDGKALLGDHITKEELWACTTCNACVEACPVNIDPLDIIMDLRQYLIMEESKAPEALTVMSTNIENNGAPWQFSAADRFKWAEEDDQ